MFGELVGELFRLACMVVDGQNILFDKVDGLIKPRRRNNGLGLI